MGVLVSVKSALDIAKNTNLNAINDEKITLCSVIFNFQILNKTFPDLSENNKFNKTVKIIKNKMDFKLLITLKNGTPDSIITKSKNKPNAKNP